MKSSRGFTLIELVIVIIVLGVLAAIAAPKFVNLQSEAYKSTVSGAVASVKSAASLFKSKSLMSDGSEKRVEFDGIVGANHQPWAASSNGVSPSDGYATPPEIFKAAGLNVAEWSYRIFVQGTYHVTATPKGKLDSAQPTRAQVEETNCYFQYKWEATGTATVKFVDTGC